MAPEVRGSSIPDQIIDVWQRLVDSVSTLLTVPSVMSNRLKPPDLHVMRSNNSPDNPFPTGTVIPMLGLYCEAAARRRHRLMVEDARVDPEWADSPTAKAGISAYLGFPIFWPDGQVFGTICAVDTKRNGWGATADGLLGTVKEAIEAHLALVATTEELNTRNAELVRTLEEVRTLRGLLPICSSCKKVRDDKGYWNQIEEYIAKHSEARFSHGICPDCARKLFPEMAE